MALNLKLPSMSDLPAVACIFHDIASGDVDIPCGRNHKGKDYDCFGADSSELGELSSSDVASKAAYEAGVGYDLATGLESVNATNLFDAWPD